jgi:hypothetical protein
MGSHSSQRQIRLKLKLKKGHSFSLLFSWFVSPEKERSRKSKKRIIDYFDKYDK